MPLEAHRSLALRIVRDLNAAGYVAYWVGGCVRDQLLGLTPKDYDVATSARPEVVLDLFRGSTLVGASFGVVLVPDGVEVATFRSEMNYEDGRRPNHVQYETDPALDAARRDFTINGLYYDPVQDEVIDFHGGQADLSEGIIRAIGEPRERFAEDHLRLLRAVRFAARFRFVIEPATLDAVREMAPLIRRIAGERLHDEMRRILTGPNLDLAWNYLRTTGLWQQMAPGAPGGERLVRLQGPVSTALGWAALLHRSSDYRAVFQAFRFSREEAEQCQDLLECESWFEQVETMQIAALKRFVRRSNFHEHLDLHRATHGETLAFHRLRILQQRWNEEDLFPNPLLNGEDLIALGLAPGPRFREILSKLEDAQLEDRITTREEAVRLVFA